MIFFGFYSYFIKKSLKRALVSVRNKEEINLASVHPQEKHVKQWRRRRRRNKGEKKAVKLKQC